MANTTNFGWETPDDTDLVKDGASAIRTLGQAIDTSMADLEGGTTGQILSKASNTDMDFAWVDNQVGDITAVTAGTGISGGGSSGDVTITNSMATAIDAKGDLIVGTGADAFSRLAVGTNGQALIADSTAATGVKWGTVGGGGKVLQVVSATNSTVITTTTNYPSYANSGFTLSITPSASTSKILLIASIPFMQQNKTDLGGASRIVRGGGSVIVYPQTALYNQYVDGIGNSFATTHSHAFLDSPATTSAITYEIQFCTSAGGSSNANISFAGQTASFIAMEIGA